MNKECRMSKESGLINFIILHSLFLVQASHIQKNIFCQKMAKLYNKVTIFFVNLNLAILKMNFCYRLTLIEESGIFTAYEKSEKKYCPDCR